MSELEKFQIGRLLGRGTFGDVHQAVRLSDGQQLVVKDVKIDLLAKMPWSGDRLIEMARAEADALNRFAAHPNVVKFVASFEENSSIYLVMEYCPGGDLQCVIESRHGKFFTEKKICEMFIQIALALKHIHHQKLVHRDVKAANVFLGADGYLKLGDFGVARYLDRTNDMAQTMTGTPAYMAPEVWDNKPYGQPADIWSAGVLLYQMATLRMPFVAANIFELYNSVKEGKPAAIPAVYSKELCAALSKMMQQEPENRPTAGEVIADRAFDASLVMVLSRCVEGVSITPPTSPEHSSVVDGRSDRGAINDSTVVSRPTTQVPESPPIKKVSEPPTNSELIKFVQRCLGDDPYKDIICQIFQAEMLTLPSLARLSESQLAALFPKVGLMLSAQRVVAEAKAHLRLGLFAAAKSGDLVAIRDAVDALGSAVLESFERDNGFDYAPIHSAAKLNQVYAVALLLDLGTPTDLRNGQGNSALHVAARFGAPEVVELLIRRGLNVNTKGTKFGMTAIMTAAMNPLDDVNMVNLLLRYGAKVNEQDNEGWTALHCAAESKSRGVFKLLQQNGAKILRNNKGVKPVKPGEL